MFIHTTKSIFQPLVGGAWMPVGGGSGILLCGIGTAGSSGLVLLTLASGGNASEPGSRNQPLWMPASLRMPVNLCLEPPNLHLPQKNTSLDLQGARPKPVTQNNALRIWESISIHILRGDWMSLQVGTHMAGAALHSSRNNMPPHATTLRPYNVIRNPGMVRNHFQNAFIPMTNDVVHGTLGGGT